MTNLANAIRATLALYDIFDYPLTMSEVYQHLVNPVRLDKFLPKTSQITLGDIADKLDDLVKLGQIWHYNGFYFLSKNRQSIYDTRISRDKISARKWKKLLKLAKWFWAVPYLRGMFVSGSLAVNNSTEQGDFDVLIVAKAGRLYTCRFLLLLTASFLGARRKRYDNIAPDKFCFNQYITDDHLNIKFESIYTAHIYTNLVPILIKNDIDEAFYAQNAWLNKFIYNFYPQSFQKRQVVGPKILNGIAMIRERILDTPIGDFIERILRWYQQKRIKQNPVTYESGGRIIFDDYQMEFHPKSFEIKFINEYNQQIKKLGLSVMMENNSGLRG
jgi:hypothetical protein